MVGAYDLLLDLNNIVQYEMYNLKSEKPIMQNQILFCDSNIKNNQEIRTAPNRDHFNYWQFLSI